MSGADHDVSNPTCIPIRSDDIEYSGDTPYYIGVRPKELAVYPWPYVQVNTRVSPGKCERPHEYFTYMQAVYGYDIKNSAYIINCYRADDEDPEDEIPPEEVCERLTDYGGAKVQQGHLDATITNWEPAVPDEDDEEAVTMPIPLQVSVRKASDWKLSTEEDELVYITIIEVGLLEAIQVNINSTLAKCNVYGYNGVYVENSALHESVIESDKIIHLDNMCQVKSDIVAPYVMVDRFAMIEGDGNVMDASRYLHMKQCTNFGKVVTEEEDGTETESIERSDFVGGEYAYGLSSIDIEDTPCVKIDECTLSEVNISSAQMGIRKSVLHSCSLTFAKTSLEDDDLRNPSQLVYNHELPNGTTKKLYPATDKLREGIVFPPEIRPELDMPEVDEFVFKYAGGTQYVHGCTTKSPDIEGNSSQTLTSIDRMSSLYPYATDLRNTAFRANRRNIWNPVTREYNRKPTNPHFPYHSLTLSHLDFCTVEAATGNFYSAANDYNYSSVVAETMWVESLDSYLTDCSLECNKLKGWKQGLGADQGDPMVTFGNGSTATIGQASADIRIVAGFGSEVTLEQPKINVTPYYEGQIESKAGGNVVCASATFSLGKVEGPHKGNYTIEQLMPISGPVFEDTSSVKVDNIRDGYLSNYGQITAGDIIDTNITNYGILGVGEIISQDNNRHKVTNYGGETVKVQKKENEDAFESDNVAGGQINASTIKVARIYNRDGGIITAGSLIAQGSFSTLICDAESTLNVVEIQILEGGTGQARASLVGTIEGCSSLIIGHNFSSEDAKTSGSIRTSRRHLIQGTVTIGELVASLTLIQNIVQGSTIGAARLLSCTCRVNWRGMGTVPEFFGCLNYGAVDNAIFYNSSQLGSHISNCSFFGTGEATCNFSASINFTDMRYSVIAITAVNEGSHTIVVTNVDESKFSCALAKIQIDEDGDGVIDKENFLSVSIIDSGLTIQGGGINTYGGGTVTVSNSVIVGGGEAGSNSIINSETCSITDSTFFMVSISSLEFSATNCFFEGGQIGAGGTMTNCFYKGQGINSSLAGMTFTSDRFARAYPNVAVIETVDQADGINRQVDIGENTVVTYELANPTKTTTLQTNAPGMPASSLTQRFIYEVEDALIYGAGSYEGVGLKNITINMTATIFFEEDEEGNIIPVHKEDDVLEFSNCHIENVTIKNGDNVKFTNCMIREYNNKGGKGVTLNGCGLLGRSFDTVVYVDQDGNVFSQRPGTEVINCELFGVFSSKGTKTTTSSVGEFSDAFISSSSDSTFVKLSNGCINLNSIVFDKGAGIDKFDEEEKLESITRKDDIEGRVDLTNATNSGLIYAQNINMKNSINLGVGDMYASNFGWSGGNTNIGFIKCQNFSGVMSEGIGPLVHSYNTRDDGKTVVLKTPGGINHSDEMFTYDYGPYYVYSNGVTTLFPPAGSSASSLDADFNISSSSSDKCLPGTINVTESNEYLFNGTRANTHGWHFHERKQYNFVNVSSGNPLGFASPLPAGFTYTGSILEGIRDGNRYYAGTVTVSVSQQFEGSVHFESLYDSEGVGYQGQLFWRKCGIVPEGDGGGGYGGEPIDFPPPPPPEPRPHPDPPILPLPPEGEDPIPPTIGPGGELGPNGTSKYASFNKAFGLRIYYVSKKYYRWNPLLNQSYLASDHTFVEGVPFQGTNIGESRSFNNYILDQIIYPSILDEYFRGLATEMGIPRIFSRENQVFIE